MLFCFHSLSDQKLKEKNVLNLQYSQLLPALLPLCPAECSGSLYGNCSVVSKVLNPSLREWCL